jgi:hypothetical protein
VAQTSPRLNLPYLMPAQAQKHVTHNEALRYLDALVHPNVISLSQIIPPVSPDNGAMYGVGIAAIDDWAEHDGDLAVWTDDAWLFLTPQNGCQIWDQTAGHLLVFSNGDWLRPPMATDNLTGVGIGTTADATNRLSVQSDAVLFTHSGAGHQVKVNKATDGDSASLLFQSNWMGHAEIGLTGNNDLSLKVSLDGAIWTQALSLDALTGQATGSAVQNSVTDTASGKLMTVGAFGLGQTNDSPLMSDLNATTVASGLYKLTAATANRPTGPDSGVVSVHRHDANSFHQRICFTSGESLHRYCDAGAFTNWAGEFDTSNVVGVVTQNAGDPTGAILESGTNPNGQFIRYADGTQMCTNGNLPITTSAATFTGTVTKIDGDKLWIGRWF